MKSTAEIKKELGYNHTWQVFEPWLKANRFTVEDLPLTATNEDGETVIIEVAGKQDGKFIWKVSTLQSNNWIRINVYYPNGDVDELYER